MRKKRITIDDIKKGNFKIPIIDEDAKALQKRKFELLSKLDVELDEKEMIELYKEICSQIYPRILDSWKKSYDKKMKKIKKWIKEHPEHQEYFKSINKFSIFKYDPDLWKKSKEINEQIIKDIP